MNKVKRFWLHPEGKDRLWWAWIDAAFTLFFLVMTILTYRKFGHWTWLCSMDTFFFTFNLLFCWLNSTLYDEWKKKQPPS